MEVLKAVWTKLTSKTWQDVYVDSFKESVHEFAARHKKLGVEYIFVNEARFYQLINIESLRSDVLSLESNGSHIADEIVRREILTIGGVSLTTAEVLQIIRRAVELAEYRFRSFIIANEGAFREVTLSLLEGNSQRTTDLMAFLDERFRLNLEKLQEVKSDTSKILAMLERMQRPTGDNVNIVSLVSSALEELRHRDKRFCFDIQTSIGMPESKSDQEHNEYICSQSVCIDKEQNKYLTVYIKVDPSQDYLSDQAVGHFSIRPSDPEASIFIDEKLQEVIQHGRAVEIDCSLIGSINTDIPDVFQILRSNSSGVLRIESNVLGFPEKLVKLTAFNQSDIAIAEISIIRLKLAHLGTKSATFSNREENKAFSLELTIPLSEDAPAPQFSFQFNPTGFQASHLYASSKFCKSLIEADKIKFFDLESESTLFDGIIASQDTEDLSYIGTLVYKLSVAARRTGQDFVFPDVEQVSPEDDYYVSKLFEIVTLGYTKADVSDAKANVLLEGVRKIVDYSQYNDYIVRIGKFSGEISLFDGRVSFDLGKNSVCLRGVIDDLDTLRKRYRKALKKRKEYIAVALKRKGDASEAVRVFDSYYHENLIPWLPASD